MVGATGIEPVTPYDVMSIDLTVSPLPPFQLVSRRQALSGNSQFGAHQMPTKPLSVPSKPL